MNAFVVLPQLASLPVIKSSIGVTQDFGITGDILLNSCRQTFDLFCRMDRKSMCQLVIYQLFPFHGKVMCQCEFVKAGNLTGW